MTSDEQLQDPVDAGQRVAEHEFWYHTIDVEPGVTTPGFFDLRHAVDRFPWPEHRSKPRGPGPRRGFH